MDLGFLLSGLLTGLREGVEAALIVSIILAYLAKTGNARHFGKVWIGIGAALALSFGGGFLLWTSTGGFPGAAEDLFEGTVMLAAAAVVTWMLFWMRRIEGQVVARPDAALVEGSIVGLATLAFMEVIGEGIDTALFLIAQASSAGHDASALSTIGGGVAGLAVAVVIGFALYGFARRIDRRSYFVWAGITLIFIAAGLLSHAVREYVTAGWITVGTSMAFDISAVLPHVANESTGLAGVVGSILRAIFGYTSRPEWIVMATWVGYLIVVTTTYLRPSRPAESVARPPREVRAPFVSRPSSQDPARAT